MARIMVVGDTHGGSGSIYRKMNYANKLGVTKMIIVGDFGMWPGIGGVEFLDSVQRLAEQYEVDVYALPGNHEDHDQWDKWLDMGHKDRDGFTHVRSMVRISPKVHNWTWDKKRFFITGGAVSIDRGMRTLGKSYWANETFSEDALSSVEKYAGPDIDYLFAHDCSDFTPWGFHLVPDPESQANRKRIDRAIAALRPKQMFHGHMHHKYEWVNTESHGQRQSAFGEDNTNWNGKSTKTYGLDCDNEKWSWGILDTNKDEFTWGPEFGNILYS